MSTSIPPMPPARLPRLRLLAVLAALGALTLTTAACGSDDSADGGSAGASSAQQGSGSQSSPLEEKTFVAVSIDGGPAIVSGSQIALTFEDGRLSANAGCNTMVGEVTVEGETLSAGPLASTLMACEQALMDQDTWLSTFLESSPTWELSGKTLTLISGGETLTLQEQ